MVQHLRSTGRSRHAVKRAVRDPKFQRPGCLDLIEPASAGDTARRVTLRAFSLVSSWAKSAFSERPRSRNCLRGDYGGDSGPSTPVRKRGAPALRMTPSINTTPVMITHPLAESGEEDGAPGSKLIAFTHTPSIRNPGWARVPSGNPIPADTHRSGFPRVKSRVPHRGRSSVGRSRHSS